MIKKIFIIAAVLFALILVWWAVSFNGSQDNKDTRDTTIRFADFRFVHDPASATPESTPVADFLNNGITISDIANPGSHILAGSRSYCLDGICPDRFIQTQFAIEYTETNHYFSIVLLEEPIRDARFAAEDFLQQQLGVSRDKMCDLNYSLSVPFFVNQDNAGKELRFSFCEGSVPLN